MEFGDRLTNCLADKNGSSLSGSTAEDSSVMT